MDEKRESRPCETCAVKETCDIWEMQHCCTLCRWRSGELEPLCEYCDPWDI